jgi:hypothetical protein
MHGFKGKHVHIGKKMYIYKTWTPLAKKIILGLGG